MSCQTHLPRLRRSQISVLLSEKEFLWHIFLNCEKSTIYSSCYCVWTPDFLNKKISEHCIQSLKEFITLQRSCTWQIMAYFNNCLYLLCLAWHFSAKRGKSHLVQLWKTASAQTYVIFSTGTPEMPCVDHSKTSKNDFKQFYLLIIYIWQQSFLLYPYSELCYFSSSALVCCFTHAAQIQYCSHQFFNFLFLLQGSRLFQASPSSLWWMLVEWFNMGGFLFVCKPCCIIH